MAPGVRPEPPPGGMPAPAGSPPPALPAFPASPPPGPAVTRCVASQVAGADGAGAARSRAGGRHEALSAAALPPAGQGGRGQRLPGRRVRGGRRLRGLAGCLQGACGGAAGPGWDRGMKVEGEVAEGAEGLRSGLGRGFVPATHSSRGPCPLGREDRCGTGDSLAAALAVGVRAQGTDVMWPRLSGKAGEQAKEDVGGRLLTQNSHFPWAQKEIPS